MNHNRHWHKRVPHDMASEYEAKGWVIFERTAIFTMLVWPHEECPP